MVILSADIFHFTLVVCSIYLKLVDSASFKQPEEKKIFLNQYQSNSAHSNNTNRYYSNLDNSLKDEETTSTVQYDTNTSTTQIIQPTKAQSASTTTTIDPTSDLDDQIIQNSTPSSGQPEIANAPAPTSNKGPNDEFVNKSKPSIDPQTSHKTQTNVELNVLFFIIFVVCVSFVKLIYHNVVFIKRNMTEPG